MAVINLSSGNFDDDTKQESLPPVRKTGGIIDLDTGNFIDEKPLVQEGQIAQVDNAQPGVMESFGKGVTEGGKRFGEGVEQFVRSTSASGFGRGGGPLGGVSEDLANLRFGEGVEQQRRQQGADEFTQEAIARRRQVGQEPFMQTTSGKVGVFTGEVAPSLVIPGGAGGKLATKAITGAIAGAGIGALQFTEEDKRLQNIASGALFGAAAPGVVEGVKQVVGRVAPALGLKTKQMVTDLAGDTVDKFTQKRLDAAERLGVRLTPAEASGDNFLAMAQGKLGISRKGAKLLDEAQSLRIDQEKKAIRSLLDDISPDGSDASKEIRETARKIISNKSDALSSAAKPFYTKAYNTPLDKEQVMGLLSDPVVAQAYKKVLSDPIYQRDLQGFGQASIKAMDLTKREIDDQIGAAIREGANNKVRVLQGAKRFLTGALDNVSDDYKAARRIYSDDAPMLNALKESRLGKIADLSDDQLQTVSKRIFDPNLTDPKTINTLRREFLKESPDAWRKLLRNEMERRLDTLKADRTGSTVFDNLMSRDRDFKLFLRASRGMGNTPQKLIDMRRAFKDLINPTTVKTSARLSKSSLDAPRSMGEYLSQFLQKATGGQYDRAAVEIITNPKWDKELKAALSTKDKIGRLDKFASLLSKAAASQEDLEL